MPGTIPVTMIASVSEHIAGEDYELDSDLADEYIHKGYAFGTPSREFSEGEVLTLTALDQKVGT